MIQLIFTKNIIFVFDRCKKYGSNLITGISTDKFNKEKGKISVNNENKRMSEETLFSLQSNTNASSMSVFSSTITDKISLHVIKNIYSKKRGQVRDLPPKTYSSFSRLPLGT